jgi:predicted esterase
MPGYGKSTGKQQPSRSDRILEKEGPADIVKIVMKQLDIQKPILGGYDWGAAIALKMAVEKSSNFDKIIAFHPSYNEDKEDELMAIKCPTLIQWVK